VLIELFSLGVITEALRANIDWKLAFLKGVGEFRPHFHLVGDVRREPFLHVEIGQWMPYNFVAESIHTTKRCSRLSSSEVQFWTENDGFAFLSPRWVWGLGATYDVYSAQSTSWREIIIYN